MELNQFNTHDRIFVFHNQRPSYSCSGGVHFPFHRTANHFRKFPMSMCHLCTRRIGHSCLGERRPNGIQIKTIVKLHKNEKNSKDNRSLLIVQLCVYLFAKGLWAIWCGSAVSWKLKFTLIHGFIKNATKLMTMLLANVNR